MARASPYSFDFEPAHRSVTGQESLSNLAHSHLRDHHLPPLPYFPPSQRPTTINEFNHWSQSSQGIFPSTLIGPGLNPGLLPHPQPRHPPSAGMASTNNSRKRKRNDSTGETSLVGGFGPPSSGDDATEVGSTSSSPPARISSGRRNAAFDVWAFARPLMSVETPPEDQWLTSSEPRGTSKPKTPWFGCTLCSEFG
jgi:hypothetical protein